MCTQCGKNVAVIFITKIENGVQKQEGLCLRCARKMHIKPVDDVIEKMGLTDDDLDALSGDMMNAFSGMENLADLASAGDDPDGDNDEGKTATFPFLNHLFGERGGREDKTDRSGSQENSDSSERRESSRNGRGKRKFLDNYCINLNQRAREGKLDRMIGREEELERVIQILNRRQKNNPCLIGEPGVGKTAIAEGLSQRIVSGNVPFKLQDKEVYLLDLTSLVAGTQFRGQFESRMKGLIEEIRKQGNIILMIDEVHNLVGAGDAEGSMNAANILKPALSRGEIQVIGATTFTEYRKHIEKDTALERRFQPVTVNEPSIDDSIKIMEGIAHYYEDFHEVEIPKEMCRAAVIMSERYITDRFLPDKAIDLIDEACSDVNLKNKELARREQVEKEIADLALEQDLLMQDTEQEHYERLAEIRSDTIRLNEELDQLKAKGRPKLTMDNIARIIELWTKIPASTIKADELERLAALGDRLREHIVGQDPAIESIVSAIRRNRIGLASKRKPVSFIFVGSTGVGKTELVKRLAEDMFNSPESLIRLDMSEFMEKFSVSRIIGSPPGYVGYDEAGQLTEKIRRKPYSVVLFDEIEKAHPDVMNILLQILDDGRITDAQGRTVNFENTIIVMTTNAGSGNKTGSVGFGGSLSDMSRERAMKALNEFLRPEFLNRVDEVVCFNQLTEENFRGIAALMLSEVKEVLEAKNIALSWDESLVDHLVKEAYSVTYGARNLRRVIQKQIEDVLAQRIVENRGQAVSRIALSAADGKVKIDLE